MKRGVGGAALLAVALVLAPAGLRAQDASAPLPVEHAAPATGAAVEPPAATAAPSPAAAAASPVTVTAAAEPVTTTIGTPFRLTVEVAAAPDTEIVLAQPTERLGDFDIVDYGTAPAETRDGRAVMTRWYRLVGYTPGRFLIPSPPVAYRLPGQTLAEAPGDEAVVELTSLVAAAPDATDVRDIKPPIAVPPPWRLWAAAAATVLVLLVLAVVLARLLGGGRRPAASTPAPPAHVVAYEALARLRARRLVEQGAFKEYYSGLSGIVRTYVEQRFRLRAPEMTTEEFLLASARDGGLAPAHRGLLGEFLTQSDLVKFARHVPTVAASEEAYGAARRFVEDTAEAPPAAGESDAAR